MHWLLTLTALAATTSLCTAAPSNAAAQLFRRQEELEACPSDSQTCFGPSKSKNCRGCNENCFALNDAGELCNARYIQKNRAGAGTPTTECACDADCKAG